MKWFWGVLCWFFFFPPGILGVVSLSFSFLVWYFVVGFFPNEFV